MVYAAPMNEIVSHAKNGRGDRPVALTCFVCFVV